jgi:hypothetical protein
MLYMQGKIHITIYDEMYLFFLLLLHALTCFIIAPARRNQHNSQAQHPSCPDMEVTGLQASRYTAQQAKGSPPAFFIFFYPLSPT